MRGFRGLRASISKTPRADGASLALIRLPPRIRKQRWRRQSRTTTSASKNRGPCSSRSRYQRGPKGTREKAAKCQGRGAGRTFQSAVELSVWCYSDSVAMATSTTTFFSQPPPAFLFLCCEDTARQQRCRREALLAEASLKRLAEGAWAKEEDQRKGLPNGSWIFRAESLYGLKGLSVFGDKRMHLHSCRTSPRLGAGVVGVLLQPAAAPP